MLLKKRGEMVRAGGREQKEEEVRTLREKFRRARVAVLAGFSGMTVDEMRGLKSQFRRAQGEFTVVKNTLARRAAEGTDAALLADLFSGPTAVALGYDDPLLPVRILKEFSERQEKLKIRRGIIERQIVDLSALKVLAGLPGKGVLQGQVLGMIAGPLYGLAGILSGVLSEFSRVLQRRAEVQNNSNAQEGKEEAMGKLSQEELILELEGLTVLQLVELNKTLQEKWGVTAVAPVTAAAPAGTAVPGVPAAEEKTMFDVVLTGAGEKKIQVIKVVRELTNLGLKEAKDLVEGAPKPLKSGVSKEEAENIKKKIEEQGGKAEIK